MGDTSPPPHPIPVPSPACHRLPHPIPSPHQPVRHTGRRELSFQSLGRPVLDDKLPALTQKWLVVDVLLMFTETVGLLRTGAQDGHLDFHTAPEP